MFFVHSIDSISIDRHKAELRRAANDEKLYTIAKKLSHGECVSKEWIKQSKRLIPLLPNFLHQNSKAAYYRILADHIVKKASPILQVYPEPYETSLMAASEDTEQQAHEDSLVKISSDVSYQDLVTAAKNGDDAHLRPKNGRMVKKKRKKIERLRLAEQDQNLLELGSGYLVNASAVIGKI